MSRFGRIGLSAGLGLGVLGGLVAVGACALGAPGYRGPPRANFDGETFENIVPTSTKSMWTVARWRLTSSPPDWQPREPRRGDDAIVERVGIGELRVTWVNHATALIQVDGLNILTDPIWSDRASPLSWLGPQRYHPPCLALEELPPIDAVMVSHNHYDHFDVPTLARLASDHQPRILAGLGSRGILEEESISGGEDLAWWESVQLSETVRVTAVPAQHWSRRGWFDTKNTLWAGFVIESRGGPVYYSGDTGWGPHFELIAQRFGPMRLAVLPIGAFKPRWFMREMHISPEEAADAALVLQASTSLAVHWGTFRLGDDGQDEPPEVLRRYLGTMEAPPRFWVLGFGEGRDVPPLEPSPLLVAEEERPADSRAARVD